jgi:phosphonoacetaldehyde hydrolase
MSQIYDFAYQRSYRGPVQAVLLDWAGTTMDFGCVAPAVVFVEVFRRKGVPISMEEARVPMGAHKRVHIQKITRLDAVRARWQEKPGRAPGEDDVDAMFADFIPLQLECLSTYSELIPGTLEVVAALRRKGIRIGSTTGYTTEMTAINLRDAERQGYKPDSTVSASEMPAGRPYPFMCLQNAINLQVDCVAACVKVDDTIPGIEEGLKNRSAVNLDHVQTMEQRQLASYVGSLSPEKMKAVCRALSVATGCSP